MEIWNYVFIACTVFLSSVGAITIIINIIPSCIEAYDEYRRRQYIKNLKPEWADTKAWNDTRIKHYE